MTITINPLETLRFIFICGWLVLAGISTLAFPFSSEKVDVVWTALVWILCGGSAAVLYFGR